MQRLIANLRDQITNARGKGEIMHQRNYFPAKWLDHFSCLSERNGVASVQEQRHIPGRELLRNRATNSSARAGD
jgi:hypothetical protein